MSNERYIAFTTSNKQQWCIAYEGEKGETMADVRVKAEAAIFARSEFPEWLKDAMIADIQIVSRTGAHQYTPFKNWLHLRLQEMDPLRLEVIAIGEELRRNALTPHISTSFALQRAKEQLAALVAKYPDRFKHNPSA